MKKHIILIILSTQLIVEASEPATSNDFESLINSVSEIATKKSLNIDYLPSVVTVVDGQTFLDAGIQNIGEALDMLPGIQMQTSPMGYTTTTVRGLKMPNAYLSDKIKILIDGVAINNEVTGSSNFYMDFPMQLVEKIEVLRGPNSTIYGAGAFYGTVNVITRLGNNKTENQLFLGTGSYEYRTAGSNLSTSIGDWKLFTDGYYKQNNKSLPVKDKDQGTEEAMQDYSVGLKAINGGFEFLTRFKKSTYGNFYSFEGDLDPIPGKNQGHTNSYFFSQLSYKTSFHDYKLETKANFSHRESNIDANIYSASTIAELPAPFGNRLLSVGITPQEGFYTHEKTGEENFEAEAILTLPKIQSNDILVGAGIRQVNITQNDFYSSLENLIMQNEAAILSNPNYNNFRYNATKEPAFWANPTTKLLRDGVNRTIGYAYAQDLISLTDDIDLILGLRADAYSDYGMHVSKRAGLVYRATDKMIFKLLYGSAFRVPTLIEAYQNGHINTRAGDSTIQPEETDTYEATWIYSPTLNHKFSLNLFYSQLKNIIDLEEFTDTIPGYQNFKQRYSKGVEFEYFYHTERKHNLYFNATYVYSEYTIPPENRPIVLVDQSMPDISKVMLKAMYIYRPTEKLSFGTTWRYFSETTATKLYWVTNDSTADAVHIFDETLTYHCSPSSEIRLTVKNILNREVHQPSYYYNIAGGIIREGRNYFLNYTLKF
ncbi:TonB-dependent receptor plug domain-containing protein [Sulfuricurvum sp.]|uniref:TonB-dependent receptor plug domain-containing protein n=1 Tax=Sulfuricurvum sp. TaxID=2025608 RepID=UPI0035662E2F